MNKGAFTSSLLGVLQTDSCTFARLIGFVRVGVKAIIQTLQLICCVRADEPQEFVK